MIEPAGRPGRPAQLAIIVLAIVLAPLAGAMLTGDDLRSFLRFPPRPLEAAPESFTGWVFGTYLVAIVAVLLPFLLRIGRTGSAALAGSARSAESPRTYPLWGWLGVALRAVSWFIAWVPLPGLEEARRLSFTPLWVGYAVAISAWVQKRGGRCLLTEAPWIFLALFPASAGFWYLFEYLNQFTGNWIYDGTGVAPDREALSWFLRSALPFSTVLPAVLATRDLLATWPRLSAGLDNFVPIRPRRPRRLAAIAWVAGVIGLAAVAIWPTALYSLLWVAPPLIIVATQALAGERHAFTRVASGDWRGPWLAVVAALFCGLCWELWNIFSLARWTYHIPHAQVLHLFEMPLLGYAGYLPFGITCVVAAHLLTGLTPDVRNPEDRKP